MDSYPPPHRNTNGTLNNQARIHKLQLILSLAPEASVDKPSDPNLDINYLDTVLLTGPDGTPTTGLDADITGFIQFPGFPPLPGATFPGDGFGGAGPGGHRISMDCEGLALGKDGTFWVSDEYGPYIYQFSSDGKMLQAIQPPDAFLPRRNGTISFSAASPPFYNAGATPIPADPQTGRNNNQGFEGLTLSPDGENLFVLIQSALNQEGGPNKRFRRQARLLQYGIDDGKPKYKNELAVTLPTYIDPTEPDPMKAVVVAGQSEIHFLPTRDFLILARDSGAGHGQARSESKYRQADIFSISRSTTDLKSDEFDKADGAIASSLGVLKPGITPVEYCPFLNFNNNSELGKFKLHNGGPQDAFLLNEKWESLAMAPVDEKDRRRDAENEYFLFSFSDNDYVTQDGQLFPNTSDFQLLFSIKNALTNSFSVTGHLNFGMFSYSDGSGFNLDNQALVFRISF
jgi:hypothetical protein